MSKKRQEEWRLYVRAKRKFLREHTDCFKCEEFIPLKERELHHWAGRNGALLYYVPYFRCACRKCHDWIHNNVKAAQKAGWIAPAGVWGRMPKGTT